MQFPSRSLEMAEELVYPLVDRIGALRDPSKDLRCIRVPNIVKLVRKLQQVVERQEAQSTVSTQQSTKSNQGVIPSNSGEITDEPIVNDGDIGVEVITTNKEIATTEQDKGKGREKSKTPVNEVDEAKLKRRELQTESTNEKQDAVRFSSIRN
jgi:hypothetical protein